MAISPNPIPSAMMGQPGGGFAAGLSGLLGGQDPLFNIGMGLLSANQRSLTPQNPFTHIMQFQQMGQRNQAQQLQMQTYLAQLAEAKDKREREASERRLREEALKELSPQDRAWAALGLRPPGADVPSALQVYQAYEAMTPEQRTLFERSQRSPQWLDLGGQYVSPQPPGIAGVPAFNKGLPPEALPEVRGAQARESAIGEALGKEAAAAPGVINDLDKVEVIARKLSNDPSIDAVYGTIQGRVPSMRQSTVDAESLADQLVESLSVLDRQKLVGQGQISDFEYKALQRSATRLTNKNISEGEAREEIQTVLDILDSKRKRAEGFSRGAPITEQGATWSIRPK